MALVLDEYNDLSNLPPASMLIQCTFRLWSPTFSMGNGGGRGAGAVHIPTWSHQE